MTYTPTPTTKMTVERANYAAKRMLDHLHTLHLYASANNSQRSR